MLIDSSNSESMDSQALSSRLKSIVFSEVNTIWPKYSEQYLNNAFACLSDLILSKSSMKIICWVEKGLCGKC